MIHNRGLFFKHLGQTSPSPIALEIIKAKGSILIGQKGRKYIDLISGIAVSNIGHNNSYVQKAMTQQIQKHSYLMVYGEYIISPQVQLAKRLTQELHRNLNSVFLVNSGSEAIEVALKLAKRYTGKTHLIACKNAYHGSTHGALSLMGDEYYKNAFRPLLPNIDFIEFNNIDSLNCITHKTAAVVIEPVQGEAGVILPNIAFFKALQKKCKVTKTLLIFDEIQTGFGRCGTLFAHQALGITPDILVLGKALGGGMPLGAVVSPKKIMDNFTNNPVLGHITTFGGHPVSCSAAIASLDFIIQKQVLKHLPEKQNLFLKKLSPLKPIIKIRNFGMMFAVEFKTQDQMMNVINYCIKHGVIVDWFLFNNKSMRICPPLTIQKQEIESACNVIINAIQKYS